MTLEELFGSIAKIHTDAFLVWNHLTAAYPPDYFVGCIEDAFGAFFDNESQEKLYGELQSITEALRNQIEINADRFEMEKKQMFIEFEER